MKLKGRKLSGPYVRWEPGTGVLSGPHAAVLSMTLGARLSPVSCLPASVLFSLSSLAFLLPLANVQSTVPQSMRPFFK